MKIIIVPAAQKDLKKFSKKDAEIILRKIYTIRDDPLRYVERLEGVRLWKLRIGEYRAIMVMNTKEKIINIVRIRHRKNVYKKL